MERVCARPNSLQSLRQRVFPEMDNGFKSRDHRYGQTTNKLQVVANQLSGMTMIDSMRYITKNEDKSQRMRPHTTSMPLDKSEFPSRYLSSSGPTFSYDGLDLTGVIQSRVLMKEPSVNLNRRDHNESLTLKKHIRKLEERRVKSAPNATLSSASISSLDERKQGRDQRMKPWTDKKPKKERIKTGLLSFDSKPIHGELTGRFRHIKALEEMEEKWKDEREEELSIIKRCNNFQPITILLISSQLRNCTGEEFKSIVKSDPGIIPIIYDYQWSTYKEMIVSIRSALFRLRDGLKAEKIIIVCQGGPGYLFLLYKQIITAAKIKQDQDLRWFWKEVGKLLSRQNPDETSLLIAGCEALDGVAGKQLLKQIKAEAQPNRFKLLELSSQSPDMDKLYLIQKTFTSEEDFNDLMRKSTRL